MMNEPGKLGAFSGDNAMSNEYIKKRSLLLPRDASRLASATRWTLTGGSLGRYCHPFGDLNRAILFYDLAGNMCSQYEIYMTRRLASAWRGRHEYTITSALAPLARFHIEPLI